MSYKTTFKRISLALVAALGVGVLSTGSASAFTDEAFTISASTGSVVAGETLSATITLSFVGNGDTTSVNVTGGGSDAHLVVTTDSVSVGGWSATHNADISGITCSNGTYCKQVFTLNVAPTAAASAASNLVYTITSRTAKTNTVRKAVTFTVTRTASTVGTPVVAKTTAWIVGTPQTAVHASQSNSNPLRDSALVVSAGAAATPVNVAFLYFSQRNSSDTTTGVTAGRMTAVITGPGLLGDSSTTGGSKAKQISPLTAGETITVWSDGSGGTATISIYLGTSATAANLLTQAAKTITFSGAATSFASVKNETGTVAAGITSSKLISFEAKDVNSNAVTSAALNTYSNFYAVSSDTRVLGTATQAWVACDAPSTGTTWYCNIPTVDSGTASITISDSKVATGAVKSSAVDVVVAGAAYTGTLAWNKASYVAGEQAILTVTCKDRNGNNVPNNAVSDCFTGDKWDATTGTPTFVNVSNGWTTDLPGYLNASTFVNGIETAVVTVPTTKGTWTYTAQTSGTGTESKTVTLNLIVTDPAEEAANSALDAAQEATDAAIAATDAAVLAQESADAAAVAAEAAAETAAEAAEASKAALDAVTKLSAEVTKLLTQLATLQSLMNRIAKKVGVKV